MEEWNIIKAYDYCYNVTDGTHDSPKQTEFGKYLITSKHIKDNRIDFESAYKISEDDYNKIITRSKVDQWDIIISMIGAYCGFCCIESSKQTDYAIKNVGLLKVGNELKCKWLYYYLTSPHGKQQLSKLRSGSSQPYISLGALRNLDIPVPNENTMSDIVSVLSSLDSKIELNRRINDNLEQQAQALFKSWFVDFEPFKDGEFVNSEFGMIPKGWRTGVLSDIIEILSGFAFKSNTFEFEGKYKLVTIKAVQDGYLELNEADGINDVPVKVPRHCFLKKKDILLSLTGNVGRCCLVNSDNLLLNQRVAKIEPKKIADWAYTYILFRLSDTKTYLETISRGTAQANLSPIETANMPILIPTREVMDAFSVCATPLVNYSMVLTIEAEKLAQQRDTLLPKLMSGELKINDLTR